MQRIEMLRNLKMKLGIKSDDEDVLLNLYLDDATGYIQSYCNLKELTDRLDRVAVDMVVIYYNKNGVEGQISHSEGGISRAYTDGLPKEIVSVLKSERKLV